MVGAKEAVLLLVVVACLGSTPGVAQTDDDSKMSIEGLEDAVLAKNHQVSYAERQFKDGLTSNAEEKDGDDVEDEDADEEDAAAGGDMSKLRGNPGPQDKRKYAFRSDLGKRSRIHHEPEVHSLLDKRYRSFKADLGKRYSRFRSDLGKRFDLDSTTGLAGDPERLEADMGGDDLGIDALYPRPEKRPRFRADLGKRVRYEASRRVFRADLGKRRMFRSDLG